MLLAFPAFAFSQVVKTAAIPYTGSTSFTPNIATSSELRIDTATSVLYWWKRDALTWMRYPHGIDVTTGGSAPAYTPRDNQGRFAINNDNELYYYTGSSWVQVGGSGGGGIYGGSGNVPDGTVATLVDDFEFSGPDISSYTVTTGTSTGGQYFQNFTGATVSCRDTTGDNYMSVTKNGIEMQFDGNFDRLTINDRDARYAADYSATYSDRSLVDKEYVDGLIAGTGSGPDSTFAKISGGYVGKRIGDNVYKYGTLGVRTLDTVGIINTHNLSSTKPSWYNSYSDAGSGRYLSQFAPLSQTDNGSLGNFNFTSINVTGANSPYSSRANHVWLMGYNVAPGGGRVLSADASLHNSYESNFYNVFASGRTKRSWEWHLQSMDTIGNVHRMISGRGSHDGRDGDMSMQLDGLVFIPYNGGDSWMDFDRNRQTTLIGDTTEFWWTKTQVGTPFFRFRNADNSAYITMFQADASNRLVINPAGNGVYSYADWTFNTKHTITTDDGSEVEIGNSSKKSFLSIYAPSAQVLQLRSNSGGSNLWNTYVNSDNIVYTLPSGSNYLQFYTNSTYILGANDRIGIGTTPGARFHVRQNGNGGGNGIQLTNSDASFSAYEALDASGDRIFYQTGGSMRLKFTQAGDLLLATSGSPASKLSVSGGVGVGSTYAGTNAAPTNGLLVEGQTVIGTTSATTNAELTVAGETAIGTQGAVSLINQAVQASGRFATNGDAQGSTLVLRREITGTAQTELFLDGASVQAILSATNRIWNFRVDVVGVCNTVGNGVGISAGESFVSWHSGGIKRLNTTTSLIGTVQAISTAQADTGMATTAVSIVADDASEAISIRITPPSTAGSTTVTRWVATLHLVECAY